MMRCASVAPQQGAQHSREARLVPSQKSRRKSRPRDDAAVSRDEQQPGSPRRRVCWALKISDGGRLFRQQRAIRRRGGLGLARGSTRRSWPDTDKPSLRYSRAQPVR